MAKWSVEVKEVQKEGEERGGRKGKRQEHSHLPDLLWVVIMSILQKRGNSGRVGSFAPGLPALSVQTETPTTPTLTLLQSHWAMSWGS